MVSTFNCLLSFHFILIELFQFFIFKYPWYIQLYYINCVNNYKCLYLLVELDHMTVCCWLPFFCLAWECFRIAQPLRGKGIHKFWSNILWLVCLMYIQHSTYISVRVISDSITLISTSQGIVISYLFTIPWQKSLAKSQAWRCSWREIVIVCWPIRTIFSNRVQRLYNFQFPFQRRACYEIVCNWFQLIPLEPIK